MTRTLPLTTVVTTLRAYASMTYREHDVVHVVIGIRRCGRLYELTIAGQRAPILRGGAFVLEVTSRPAVSLSAAVRR